ncbi:hypothetical protein EZ428_11830 [Pedobacter frigiditerrae]|uniref:S1 motif domain-containing protein n=1 Tax=Pedobacter frigiditerrae TaxID=2530452 RepID=A0A4R0N1Z5_9SPHI|nr:AAA domain-containing protein [Pedobacter frigiditerrae]TCC92402.1 hypothetical protein EZ428_11830 [Pedobacter frigiditerrae]
MNAAENQSSTISQFIEKYDRGTVIKVTITKLIPPSQIITNFEDGYIGRMSIIDLDWSLAQSEVSFASLEIGQELQCVILGMDHKHKQVLLSRKAGLVHPADTIAWERVGRGDEYQASVIYGMHSNYLLRTAEGHFGLVPRELCSTCDKHIRVRLTEKIEYSSLFSFLPAEHFRAIPTDVKNFNPEFSFIEPELVSYVAFKKSILGTNASDEDHILIKKGFDTDAKIFSQRMSLDWPLYIQFDRDSNAFDLDFKSQAYSCFFPGSPYDKANEQQLLERLSGEKYWIKLNKFKSNRGDGELVNDFSLYNEQVNFYGHIQFDKKKKEIKFSIKKFSIGQDFAGTADKKKQNTKNGSFQFSSAINILTPNDIVPLEVKQVESFEYMVLKSDCFFKIHQLKKQSGEILRLEGRTLTIIDKFLEYQMSLLDEQRFENAFVDTYGQVASKGGGIAIEITSAIADILDVEDGSLLNVRLIQPSLRNSQEQELALLSDARLSIQGPRFILTFLKEIKLSLLDNGFYLDKRVSKKQFQLQRSIIQDFLENKIKIDHIESMLIKGDKIHTPHLAQVTFKNPDLLRTEQDQPDNNQVSAVKKAIGNQNIFLIQGPPGTGKTTVIAEIIQQLTEQGEKILVAGQNHVAVDNVLEKISRDPKLNLLRVGNPDRVDPNLLKYSIDYLAEDHKVDFRRFLTNQVNLAKQYFQLLVQGVETEKIREQFKAWVELCAEQYEKMQAVYRERHFVFRETLLMLTAVEIEKSIRALENWIQSIQSEYETLLKPLIYSNVDVVFATCIGIKTDQVFKYSAFKFDTVIIDEAGKANIAESLVAIELGKKVILVGDQMQLPPYMDSALIDENDPQSFPRSRYGGDFQPKEIEHALKTSFFEFIINRIPKREFPRENLELLNYQHRMHPNIGEFISEAFYGGKVKMGSRTHLNHLALPAPFDKEIIFIDTSNAQNPYEQNDGFSAKNNLEAESIAESILPTLFNNSVAPQSIAVIAPYKSQVSNIKRYINGAAACTFKNIDVSTLDSFQGMEYDIIIFSFTRSVDHRKAQKVDGKNKYSKVGFLDDARRLNVAFSRAKKKLILIGNALTLGDRRSHYDGLFNYTQLFNNLINLSKKEEIGNFVNIADFKGKGVSSATSMSLSVGMVTKAIVKGLALMKTSEYHFGLFVMIGSQQCLAHKAFNPDFQSFNPGDELNVKILKIEEPGNRISVKILPPSWEDLASKLVIGQYLTGEVVMVQKTWLLVRFSKELAGSLSFEPNSQPSAFSTGKKVEVAVEKIDFLKKRIYLKR